jgi:hypothetical protein
MLSRIFWVGFAGLALVTGMILQDGDMFGWRGHDDAAARVDDAVAVFTDRGDRIRVVGSDMHDVDLYPETNRALASAVGRLVKAEGNLALLGIGDADDKEMAAAQLRRDQARTEVETLKAEIDRQRQVSQSESALVEQQIRDQVREQVREEIRDAVRN